ncbi:MAG TPA: PhzF family phenazine biosynthesis protein [Thermoanaerobaculia bacterium]|nr:PhzF family phenazine biosynthesis protein [Thermoanaerobaculia bacterium]
MTKLRQYQVDAFASRPFEGNPAAVCPLDRWLDDRLMQSIAAENNLSETAFFVPTAKGFHLRWFTPVAEVDLCGHATLAAAHVVFGTLGWPKDAVTFATRSGDLTVTRDGDRLWMDFPSRPPRPVEAPAALLDGLRVAPVEVLAADDWVVVLRDEAAVRSIAPDFPRLRQAGLRGVTVTARGETADFVSRFFAPGLGIDEDPVTGSAHCELAPYWAPKLGSSRMRAQQVSKRGGEVLCELRGDRVLLGGTAITFMEGWIDV